MKDMPSVLFSKKFPIEFGMGSAKRVGRAESDDERLSPMFRLVLARAFSILFVDNLQALGAAELPKNADTFGKKVKKNMLNVAPSRMFCLMAVDQDFKS